MRCACSLHTFRRVAVDYASSLIRFGDRTCCALGLVCRVCCASRVRNGLDVNKWLESAAALLKAACC